MTTQTKEALQALGLAAAVLAALISVIGLSGCCTARLRTQCCPPPVVREVPVKVATPCALPPVPVLPGVLRSLDCPAARVCFDIPNAAKLAEREAKMKTWIRETAAACGSPSAAGSRPAGGPP